LRWLAAAGIALAVAMAAAPHATQNATARTAPRTPPEQRTALRPGLQLAAMRTAIAAAPAFYAGYNPGCDRTIPVIAYVAGQVMGGNFRDESGGCYVWINLAHSPLLTAQEICKLALHEAGHLTGLQHSQDPDDVMYSPFRSDPIPQACIAALGSAARN
jgi:hypothetical protein